jgi:hypothetical protein
MGPQVSFIVGAFPHSCATKRLAGVATSDDVNFLNFGPINLGDVAQVGHAWVVGFHDLAGRWLNLGVPGQITTHGQIKAAVTAEQAADPHATPPKLSWKWA